MENVNTFQKDGKDEYIKKGMENMNTFQKDGKLN